jgi:hypothetical protein
MAQLNTVNKGHLSSLLCHSADTVCTVVTPACLPAYTLSVGQGFCTPGTLTNYNLRSLAGIRNNSREYGYL